MQAAEGILNIVKKIVDIMLKARFAAVFLDLLESTESQVGAAQRLCRRQARGNEVLDALLQMEAQLRIQALFRDALVEQTAQPAGHGNSYSAVLKIKATASESRSQFTISALSRLRPARVSV